MISCQRAIAGSSLRRAPMGGGFLFQRCSSSTGEHHIFLPVAHLYKRLQKICKGTK